jgi:hypothetical protein
MMEDGVQGEVEHGRAIGEANVKAERNREVGFGSLRLCLARVRSTSDSRRFAALRELAKSGRKET